MKNGLNSFSRMIPENERIPQSDLLKKFEKELSGIFNWALEGWRQFRDNGNKILIPDIIKNATLDYRNETSILSEFLSGLETSNDWKINQNDKSLHTKAVDLFTCFKNWCEYSPDERSNPFSNNRQFYDEIRGIGFECKSATNNQMTVFGIENTEGGLIR